MTSPGAVVQHRSRPWKRLLNEIGPFGVVGGVALLIDLGMFQVFYAVAGWGAVTSTGLSTLVSTTAAFVGHRYWSFSHRARTGVRREYLLFAVVNGATLLISLGVVAVVRYPLGQESAAVLTGAKFASIAIGTVLRFIAYKVWVFPPAEGRGETTRSIG
ncbi:GtrA family protein [Goekera deserti]|uniref:GtrA family protein n=1 Tax=Goekera deserti TaxID=2497753 RepID=UPI001F3C16AC|nr:GtrA family protein [Goekera deserti]